MDFRNHLRDCIKKIEFASCLVDTNLWMRRAVLDSGEHYYEYVLLYVDDYLVILQHPQEILNKINYYFRLKPGSIEPPTLYLGAKTSKIQLLNRV